MKKKYYLYHQTRTELLGLTFVFVDQYDTKEEALAKMEQLAKGIWPIWKIEEVYEFEPS